jgi:acyl-coenzyme A synthetase/AMP-(fatty) acid ligase
MTSELKLTLPAPQDAKENVVTLLISPSHDNLCLWMALARMGYTTQFISPAHVPNVIATLIGKAESRAVIHSGLDSEWIKDSRDELSKMDPRQRFWTTMPSEVSLNSLLNKVRSSSSLKVEKRARDPSPFVIMHSFGSTSTPKLYPLGLESANLSANDSAKWWISTPTESRWRCQLQTSVSEKISS